MPDYAICVTNLGKRYRLYASPFERLKEIVFPRRQARVREFVALEGVNLKVPRGCALGIVGPNGAGKSTLLKVLAGVIEPSQGQVEMRGKIASIIELGAGFHPEFTGRENVMLNLSIQGYSTQRAQEMYEGIAQFAELGRYMDMPVKTYSSGMFVRLAFAVAVSSEPEILLIDEALAVGDAVFAHRCLGRIREMRERGVTIVLVSHDTNAILGACDHAIFIDRGQLVAEGPPKDVIHLYLLNVAERLTSLKEKDGRSTSFHEVGAQETTAETGEKRFGSFQARITDIFLEDVQGTSVEKLVSGQLVRVRMIVRFDKQVKDPVFGLMFKNRFGVEMFGTNTYLKKMETGLYEHGSTAEVTFELPMQLGAGIYSLSLAVHTPEGHFFDYRVDTRVFEVVGALDTIGVVHLPTILQVRPVDREVASKDDILERVYKNAPGQLLMNEKMEPFLAGEWYGPQQGGGKFYRWMGNHGQAFLRVPGDCSRLCLEVCSHCPDLAEQPLMLECFVDDTLAATCEFVDSQWQQVELQIAPRPQERIVGVRLCASRTWVPRTYNPQSTDSRELSVMVAQLCPVNSVLSGV